MLILKLSFLSLLALVAAVPAARPPSCPEPEDGYCAPPPPPPPPPPPTHIFPTIIHPPHPPTHPVIPVRYPVDPTAIATHLPIDPFIFTVTTTVTTTFTEVAPCPTPYKELAGTNNCSTGPTHCCNRTHPGLLGGLIEVCELLRIGGSCNAQTVCCQHTSSHALVDLSCSSISA